MIRRTHRSLVAILALLALVAPLAPAQNAAQQGWNPQEVLQTETYVRPPADFVRIIMTPRTDISFPSPSPDRKWFLRGVIPDRGDILDYGKPHIYLAGLQVDTKANRRES